MLIRPGEFVAWKHFRVGPDNQILEDIQGMHSDGGLQRFPVTSVNWQISIRFSLTSLQ